MFGLNPPGFTCTVAPCDFVVGSLYPPAAYARSPLTSAAPLLMSLSCSNSSAFVTLLIAPHKYMERAA